MKKFISLTVFSIAMGLLEAIVVVYLRELYYPNGFSFPLNPDIPPKILGIEIIREATTIVMLLCVGILAGESIITKICYFLFCFGVWDIFYYVGLKIFLNWPESLLTWDLLFLIPVAWVGPVIAPIICSLVMIFIGVSIIYVKEKYGVVMKGNIFDWSLALLGAFIIYLTFTWDFTKIVVSGGFVNKIFNLATDVEFKKIVATYRPQTFLWIPFLFGNFLVLFSLFKVYRRYRIKKI